jgi:hypothetical protein
MDKISVKRELGAVFLGRTDSIFFPRLKNFLLKALNDIHKHGVQRDVPRMDAGLFLLLLSIDRVRGE